MMNNSKTRFLCLLLSAALLGCGGSSSASDASEPVSNDSGKNSETEEVKEEPKEEANTLTFEELTAVDNDQCSIIIKSIEPDSMWGYTLKTVVENKSTDKTYMFSVESAAINGIKTDPMFATDVAAGKKANADITFASDSLKKNGITDFTDIELVFRVYDNNDWSADPVAYETVHVYPYGEDKATQFVREPASSDQVLVDNDQVSIIVTGYEPDSMWGYSVNLYLVNKTDKSLMYSVDEASVNGFMADPFFATSINGGKSSFTSMDWSDSVLEQNGIESVDAIEFTIRVYETENWTGEDIINETFTLNP